MKTRVSSCARNWVWFVVCLVLSVCTPLTSAKLESQHGVLRQGDRCVHTLLITHDPGEECRELCAIYARLCSEDDAVNELVRRLRTKLSRCSNRETQLTTFKQGNSCTYVFSQRRPKEGDHCPEICDAVAEVCVPDDTIGELREWVHNLGGENERLKSRIAQYYTRAAEMEIQYNVTAKKLQIRNQLLEERLRREESRAQAMNERHQSEIERLRNTVSALTNQTMEYRSDIDRCMNDLNETQGNLSQELQNVEEFRAEMRHLQDQMSEIGGQMAELQKLHEKCIEDLNSVRPTANVKDDDIEMTKTTRTVSPTGSSTRASTTAGGAVYENLKDCYDVQWSGVYQVHPDDEGKPFQVYCDMETDSGGWTVVQRRHDGSEDFYRSWDDYKNGFGDLNGEFWLGNDKIHRLTNQERRYELRVDLENFENETRYAKYDTFAISDEGDKYRLTLGSYSGDAGNSLRFNDGQQFTTKDHDNDNSFNHNCAVRFTGAWWFNGCSLSNLNGRYLAGAHSAWGRGIVWYDWLDMQYSMKRTEIKIRPTWK